jgi:hypothetical protein
MNLDVGYLVDAPSVTLSVGSLDGKLKRIGHLTVQIGVEFLQDLQNFRITRFDC